MELKVSGHTFKYYNNVSVSLRFDAVASPFSFQFYFDPNNQTHKKVFLPGSYNLCQISHEGETLITGVLLIPEFASSAVKELMGCGGYSKTGVLEDCQFPHWLNKQPLQVSGKSIKQIAEALAQPFGLKVVISDNVADECSKPIPSEQLEAGQKIKDYLSQLTNQRNIAMSHTPGGDLLLTRADTKKNPVFNFAVGDGVWLRMKLRFNGQSMHHLINVQGQMNAPTGSNNAPENTVKNPYVQSHLDWNSTAFLNTIGQPGVVYNTGFRPRVEMQTSGTDVNTQLTARQVLGKELKNIIITIECQGWKLGNRIPRPGDLVTVINPDIFLYQKTKLFIEQVDFSGNEKQQTMLITCVVPEVYNNDTPINIFTGSNLTQPPNFKLEPVDESGAVNNFISTSVNL